MKKVIAFSAIAGSMSALVACMSPIGDTSGDVPDVDTQDIEESQLLSYQGWTAVAAAPQISGTTARAKATFTRNSGATTIKAGVCLLKQHFQNSQPVTCDTDAQCPVLATGGYAYCANLFDKTSPTKYCYYRPGTPANFCVGSPVTGQPIAPGTYTTPYNSITAGTYVSYACFSGCLTSDPSISSQIVYSGGGSGSSSSGGGGGRN
jgi:hypothetical protein